MRTGQTKCRWRRSGAFWGLGLCLIAALEFPIHGGAQQAKTSPPSPLIPADDSDLTRALALAKRMKAAAGQCKACKGGGGQVSCSSAAAAAKNADDLRVNLYRMQDALKAAIADTLQHMQQLQADEDQRAASAANAQQAKTYSKLALDIGKVMVDSMSLIDNINSVREMLEAQPANMTVVPDLNDPIYSGMVKNLDTVVETGSGLVSATDDLLSAKPLGADTKGFLPPEMSDVMTAKGAVTDLINATKNYDAYYKAAANMGSAASSAEALKSLAEARKGLLNVAFKAGLKLADIQQQRLDDELNEYAQVSSEADKVMQAALADMSRLARREKALQAALDAARDAGSSAYACAAQCSEAQPPAPIPDSGGLSYGADLRARNLDLAGILSSNGAHPPANACKEKPRPALAKKPAPSAPPASTTKPKSNCVSTGGLAGAINQEACQIQHQ